MNSNPIVSITASERPPEADATKLAPNGQPFDLFMETARQRFKIARDAENDIRIASLEDFKFYADEQWPDNILADRVAAGRPCLVLNLIKPTCKIVLNEQRQARPAIEIDAKDGKGDQETADVIQGLVRHVELNSNADTAYDTAFEHATIGGFGYVRILADYIDDESVDQDIFIKPIHDPFTVYFDPNCREPDYSDARFAFIVADVDRERFKEDYPDSELAGLPDFSSVGDTERDWFSGGKIRIAEYYFVESKKVMKIAVVDPDPNSPTGYTLVKESEVGDQQIALVNGKPVQRQTDEKQVYWAKINARETLESRKLPGKSVPIIPVLGDELIVDGRRKLCGLVRCMKDAQRQYNYQRSAIVEMIALAPKAPWVAAEGTIEGYESLYEQANVRNFAVLPYKPKAVDGQLVPPPQRQFAEAPIRDMVVAMDEAQNDMRSTSGIYPSMIGAQGPEQSGRAIGLRLQQGNTTNYNWMDNLRRSMRQIGRVLLDWFPAIYDTDGRVARIVKPDGSPKIVILNAPVKQPDGSVKMFDIRKGAYDVNVSVGASQQSRHREFVESVLSLVQSAPNVGQFIMDIVVRNMEWPGANEIADRLQKMLPPQLQEPDPDNPQPQIPPQVQAQFQQLAQQHGLLVQELNAANETIKMKQIQVESAERIANTQENTKLVIAEAKLSAQSAQQLLMAEVQSIHKRLDALHQSESLDQEMQMHTNEMAMQQQQIQAQQQQAQAPAPGQQAQPQV